VWPACKLLARSHAFNADWVGLKQNTTLAFGISEMRFQAPNWCVETGANLTVWENATPTSVGASPLRKLLWDLIS